MDRRFYVKKEGYDLISYTEYEAMQRMLQLGGIRYEVSTIRNDGGRVIMTDDVHLAFDADGNLFSVETAY